MKTSEIIKNDILDYLKKKSYIKNDLIKIKNKLIYYYYNIIYNISNRIIKKIKVIRDKNGSKMNDYFLKIIGE